METLTAPSLSLEQIEQNEYNRRFWDLVSPIAEEFKFQDAFTEELNIWQKVSQATNGIVTPANIMDAIALPVSLYGIEHLNSWKGIGIAAASFMVDIVDGPAARKSKTQSALGEAIDAGGDKVKLAFALYKIWQLHLAPPQLVLAVAIQNGINTGLTLIDRSINPTPAIHPSWAGKRAIFLEQWGIGLHVIGSEIQKTNRKRAKVVKTAGSIIGAVGVGFGAVATGGYVDDLWQSRKGRRQH